MVFRVIENKTRAGLELMNRLPNLCVLCFCPAGWTMTRWERHTRQGVYAASLRRERQDG